MEGRGIEISRDPRVESTGYQPARRDGRVDPPPRWVPAVAWAAALFYLATGLWAMCSPGTFHRVVAPFDPLNVHFLRDSGAFALGLAGVLLIALTIDRRALVAALAGVGIGSIAHAISHAVDRAAGGRPGFDIPSLAVLGVALLAAAVVAARHRR